MLSLSKHLYRFGVVLDQLSSQRQRCFDKLSMTFF
jgi:hypothetical protein